MLYNLVYFGPIYIRNHWKDIQLNFEQAGFQGTKPPHTHSEKFKYNLQAALCIHGSAF